MKLDEVDVNVELRSFLASFNVLTYDDMDAFEERASRKHLRKGEYFIRQGRTCHEIAFVRSGLLRSYYYSSAGEEITYCFTGENSFISAYSSYISSSPTSENIQALSDVTLLSISRRHMAELEATSGNWLKLFKTIAEEEYIKMEKRIFMLQKESAEKRYEDLLKNQRELLQLIPLNYLSSYLGITQRHLSRIRRSMLN